MCVEMNMMLFFSSIFFATSIMLFIRILSALYQRAKQAEALAGESAVVKATLRLRELPRNIDLKTLRAALRDTGDYENDSIVAMSLAPMMTQGCFHPSIATICFTKLPHHIRKQTVKKDGFIEARIELCFGSEWYEVAVDDHFYGLTPLFCPEDWDVE